MSEGRLPNIMIVDSTVMNKLLLGDKQTVELFDRLELLKKNQKAKVFSTLSSFKRAMHTLPEERVCNSSNFKRILNVVEMIDDNVDYRNNTEVRKSILKLANQSKGI